MTKTLLLVISILCFCSVFAQEKLMTNAFNREATSLNGYWNYIVDPYENGFYNYRYEPFENQKIRASWLRWSRTHPVLTFGNDKGYLNFYLKKNKRKIPTMGKHSKKIIECFATARPP